MQYWFYGKLSVEAVRVYGVSVPRTGNKVFVVHGGLSAEEDFVLDDIRGYVSSHLYTWCLRKASEHSSIVFLPMYTHGCLKPQTASIFEWNFPVTERL